MQSDPWWSFAMAINVYMVFFMSFNPTTFRHYLWLYCLLCYGLPAIPAFVFLFIRFPGEPVYGDAVVSPSPSSLVEKYLTALFASTGRSCGAGSRPSGTRCGSTRTTCPSGSAAFYLPSSTSPWAIMCFTSGTSCATCRSATKERTRRVTFPT